MPIPKELLGRYKGLSQKEALYMKLRWLACPVSAIEEDMPVAGAIYDIGCGVGLLSNLAALRQGGRHMVGIDLSEEKIGIARKSIDAARAVRFEQADALTFTMDHPKAIALCDMLHHISIQAQESLLRHFYNVLSPGGVLLIQDIDKKPLHKYLFARAVDMVFNRMEPVYYRTSDEWKRLLENIGFRVEGRRLDRGYPVAAVLFKCFKK